MKKIAILVLIFCSANTLLGDLYNNRNQLIGERAALMGGAFTAIANDLSSAFYNPAGLVQIKKPTVSLSATAYRFLNTTRYEKTLGVVSPVKVESFSPAPTSFGVCHFLSPNIVAAFSVFQIDSYKFSSLSLYQTGAVTLDLETATTLIGTSFSIKISDSFSVGTSIFLHLFKGTTRSDETFNHTGTNQEISVQNQVLDSMGLLPSIGLQFNLSKRIKAGVNFTLETIPFSGNSKVSVSSVNQIGGSSFNTAKVDSEARLPSKLAFGLAYEKKNSFTLSLDLIYYFALNYKAPYDILKQKYPDSIHKEDAHFDLSLGCEIGLSKSLSLRFGLFSNSSGASEQEKDMYINMYGVSFGVGFIKNGLSSGIGIVLSRGESDWQYGGVPGREVSWDRTQIHITVGSSSTF